MLLEERKFWKPFSLPPAQVAFFDSLCIGGLCSTHQLSCLVHLQLRTLTWVFITIMKSFYEASAAFAAGHGTTSSEESPTPWGEGARS